MMKYVLAVLVENKPGVLVRVAGLFARRGFNIESLAVGKTLDPGISRMTIEVDADEKTLEQVIKQLNKLINVIRISNLTEEPSVNRELVLIKVKADAANRAEIQQIVETFRAKIVDVSLDSLIIEITGNEEKLEAIALLLSHYGILEIVRTGKIALLRGSKTTKNGEVK
ncbi:acetolactate synthase, small subunit [Dethiobacter alkaliphilus AHT 1]|uniref:Acetolactate synthase small subunit n=2 Tax=Dethiobacter TaxID=427925 RepID=C0GI60_DETAL|nr:acetolactate synthase, small subunit [Dethiobacter alkaliphilus AHT 1]